MRDPVTIALRCQDAGARVLALHPRTRTQMYSGHARWEEIAAVVDGARHSRARQRRHQDAARRDSHVAADELRRRHDRARLVRPAVDLRSGARSARRAPDAPGAVGRGALRHRARSRAHGEGLRARSARRRDRVPQAPRLVRARDFPARRELRKQLHAVTSLGEVEGIFADYLATASATLAGSPSAATTTSRWRSPRYEARARSRSAAAGRGRIARRRRARSTRCRSSRSESLGFATIDHHRALRQGFPEVIYGAGKTPEQIVEIATAHRRARRRGARHARLPTTPASCSRRVCPASSCNRARRARRICAGAQPPAAGNGTVLDRHRRHERPAGRRRGGRDARRAWATAWRAITDVGVAGIHRVLARRDELRAAAVVIVDRGNGRRAAVGRRRAGDARR